MSIFAFLLVAAPLLAQEPPPLYSSPVAVRFGVASQEFAYTDASGARRNLTLTVRVPNIPAGLLPLVIWSPEAFSNSEDALRTWSDSTAGAGYLTVTVTHPERTAEQKSALCKALQVEECEGFSDINWDRAVDLQRVVAAAETFHAAGPAEIRGRIDLERVVVAGFDHGANAAASLAGATRLLRTTATRAKPDVFPSTVPVAFVLVSPSGAGIEGFFDYDVNQPAHSWMTVTRPVLTVTGRGDNNCILIGQCFDGESPSRRALTFDYQPKGGKALLSLQSVEVDHGFYGSLDVADCEAKGTAPAHCALQAGLLKSTVLAFLDAQLRNEPAALAWIRNDLVVAASGGTVTWRKK